MLLLQIILWTSSALLALATVISTASFAANAAWLALSFVGVAGINFVLVQVRTCQLDSRSHPATSRVIQGHVLPLPKLGI
jgi:hypothetical protein